MSSIDVRRLMACEVCGVPWDEHPASTICDRYRPPAPAAPAPAPTPAEPEVWLPDLQSGDHHPSGLHPNGLYRFPDGSAVMASVTPGLWFHSLGAEDPADFVMTYYETPLEAARALALRGQGPAASPRPQIGAQAPNATP